MKKTIFFEKEWRICLDIFFFLPNRMSIHWLWHGAVHGILYANFLTWFLYSRKLGRQDVGTGGRRVAVTSDLLRFDLHFYFLLFWYIHIIFRSHIIPALHICWSDDPMFSSALLLWKKPSSLLFCFPLFLLFRIILIIYSSNLPSINCTNPDELGHVNSRYFIVLLFLTILFH